MPTTALATAGRSALITPEQADDLLPASAAEIRAALALVHGAMKLGPATPDGAEDFAASIAETAVMLASDGWTVSQIRTAARILALSPDLADNIRYGRPVLGADFQRVRRDGLRERRITEADGEGTKVERVITTRTGYAHRVAAEKLHSAREMHELWQMAGEPKPMCDRIGEGGTVIDTPGALFTFVEIAEESAFDAPPTPRASRRRFRLKP